VHVRTWLRTRDEGFSTRFGKARVAGANERRSAGAVASKRLVCTVLLHRRGIILVSVANKATAKATEWRGNDQGWVGRPDPCTR